MLPSSFWKMFKVVNEHIGQTHPYCYYWSQGQFGVNLSACMTADPSAAWGTVHNSGTCCSGAEALVLPQLSLQFQVSSLSSGTTSSFGSSGHLLAFIKCFQGARFKAAWCVYIVFHPLVSFSAQLDFNSRAAVVFLQRDFTIIFIYTYTFGNTK